MTFFHLSVLTKLLGESQLMMACVSLSAHIDEIAADLQNYLVVDACEVSLDTLQW